MEASCLRVGDLPKGNGNAAKKTKPMQMVSSVIDLAEGSAATVFSGLGLAFISLSSSIASSEERLQQTREACQET